MEYEIIYSGRRSISASVKEGRLTVRAPYNTPKYVIDAFVQKHKRWIEKHLEKSAELYNRFNSLSEEEIKHLKKYAKEYLKQKTEYYSNIMGLKYGRITITSAKTRFGSCTAQGNISYSYRLMLYPEPAIEYVVVHELAHLVEMNHSKRFYSVIEKVLPDYRERKRMLK